MPLNRARVRALAAIATLATVISLGGCSEADPAPSPIADPFFIDLLARARANGASDTQIQVLEDAAAIGEITYDQAETQLAEYFTCLEDAGLEPMRQPDRERPPGYRIPAYSVGLGTDESLIDTNVALLEACYTIHYDFVDTARQVQPSAVEAENADLEAHRAEILACLAEHGVSVDREATIDELSSAAIEFGLDTGVWCYEFG